MVSSSSPRAPLLLAGLACAAALCLPSASLAAIDIEAKLAEGRAFESDLEYDKAVTSYLDVIHAEAATEPQLVEAHYRSGICNHHMQKPDEASAHFRWALRRAPELTLPPNANPELVNLFTLVQDEILEEKRQEKLALDAERDAARAHLDAAAAETRKAEADRKLEELAEREAALAAKAAEKASEASAEESGGLGSGAWLTFTGGGVLAAAVILGAGTAGMGWAFNLAMNANHSVSELRYQTADGDPDQQAFALQEGQALRTAFLVGGLALNGLLIAAAAGAVAGIGLLGTGAVWWGLE